MAGSQEGDWLSRAKSGFDDALGELRTHVDHVIKQGVAARLGLPSTRAPAGAVRPSAGRQATDADVRSLRGAQPLERPTMSIYRDPRDEVLRANTPAGPDARPPRLGQGGFLQWPTPGHYGLNPSDRSVGQGDGRFGVGHRGLGKDGRPKRHDGIDIALPEVSPVRSAGDGRVISVGDVRGYGLQVMVDHGDGVQTRYAHLRDAGVRVGDKVERGQAIASSGRSGNVPLKAQPHLHFEVRRSGVPEEPYSHLGPSAYPDRPQADQLLRIWRD